MWRALRRYSHNIYRSYDGTPASLGHVDKEAAAAALAEYPTVELAHDVYEPAGASMVSEYVPPILILHGLFGSRANNRSVAKQLVKKLDTSIHCLDLRNHGSSPHLEPHTYPALASDVEEYIKKYLPNEKPIVLGHSMGAKAAMSVALRNKVDISGIVAVDNAPVDLGRTGFSKFGIYVQALQRAEGKKSLKECDAVLAEVEKTVAVRQFLLTNMKKDETRDGGYYCRVPLDIMRKELDNVAEWPYAATNVRYNGPALFIRGTESAYVADDVIPAIGHFFPQFVLEDIEAGHWLIAEKPTEFMQVLERWIRGREWE